MATAYTPGLTITPKTIVEKIRMLPLKGVVTVKVGEKVQPETVVARADLPGDLMTVKVANRLGIGPDELDPSLFTKMKVGETLAKDEIIATKKSFFGLFTEHAKSPVDGTIEYYSESTGSMGIRMAPKPVEIDAYIPGVVISVDEGNGCTIATPAAFIQGIFGIGGERQGALKLIVASPEDEALAENVPEDCANMILVGGALARVDVIRLAMERGARGFIVGGIIDTDIKEFLGYDIGVAITGQEDIPMTVVLTEGFGRIRMADRTFDLLKSLEGRTAALNGATQIRAGAQRPEIIVPDPDSDIEHAVKFESKNQLEIGTMIRIIRVPHFGELAEVTGLPAEPTVIESGSKVRILEATVKTGPDAGQAVTIPRANVEIIAG